MRETVQEVRELTTMLLRRLVATGVVRAGWIAMNFGDCCRKGTAIFRRLQPPRLDSFIRDDPLDPELLPVYSTASGMAWINDGDENSDGWFSVIWNAEGRMEVRGEPRVWRSRGASYRLHGRRDSSGLSGEGGGRSGGLGLATELLAGERRTTTIRSGIRPTGLGRLGVAAH
jgi:hypothetical protein